jgi:non-specific serine/threonine protein kinase
MTSCLGALALRVLATSREPLRTSGELVWRVPGLAAPSLDSPPTDLVELVRFAAVRLFAERARAAGRTSASGRRNARAVANICGQLGGVSENWLDDRYLWVAPSRYSSP